MRKYFREKEETPGLIRSIMLANTNATPQNLSTRDQHQHHRVKNRHMEKQTTSRKIPQQNGPYLKLKLVKKNREMKHIQSYRQDSTSI